MSEKDMAERNPETEKDLTEEKNEGSGEEKNGEDTASKILAMAETGPREPQGRIASGVIIALCFIWSCFQLFYAQSPSGFKLVFETPFAFTIDFRLDSFMARSWHLGFAMALVFLTFPAYKESKPFFLVSIFQEIFPPSESKRSIRAYVPIYDWIFAAVGACLALYIWFNYEDIIMRGGIPENYEMWLGVAMILVLLEAARRCLGPALPIIASVFLAYNLLGSHMPEFLRHSADSVILVMSSQYIATDGVFGVPLKVSAEFVFLFVLFGALLEKAGAGKYFIDVAFSLMGRFRGGPAKAAVLASGMNGLVSGSSIANTVTTGTFTIPLMKKVGLPDYKAAAVEVAASTNGQLMPPIMGAAAFIMAETIGIPYIDVVRAAFIPAVVSYIALLFVVHLESMKLGLKRVPKSELPPFFLTFLRGAHYLIPVVVLIMYLVVLRRSAITSCMLALETMGVVMLLQRPIKVWVSLGVAKSKGTLTGREDLFSLLFAETWLGVKEICSSLVTGARNMVSVGVATATAGIIVGVVTSTGLAGRFIMVIDKISMGNIYVALVLTAITSMFLGMGLPTTANYIMMASLTAPVIVKLGGDAGLVFPVLAAHLFVFYFGILADDTPPVGLAAYAAAAIAKSDPIKTGIQGFTYDMRTAILPFVFLLNIELLMMSGVDAEGAPIWIDHWFSIIWIFFVSVLAMFSFASAVQGYFADLCNWGERIFLGFLCVIMFRPGAFDDLVVLNRRMLQVIGAAAFIGLYIYQMKRRKKKEAGG